MFDYDKDVIYGDDGQYVNTICEIPKNSTLKIEYDRQRKLFVLDRVEPVIFAKPVNYGFIPGTTDEDGDPLDSLILCDEPIPTGIVVRGRVVAMLDFVDGGENDHKIICLPDDDRHWGNEITRLEDLNAAWRRQIEHHFAHYKDLKRIGTTEVRGWGDTAAAWEVIRNCRQRFESA